MKPPCTASVALSLGLLTSGVAAKDVERFQRRQGSAPDTSGSTASQQAIYQQAFTDAVGAAQAANQLPFIAGQYATGSLSQYNVATNSDQLPWNANVPMLADAAVNGSADGGWEFLPDVEGFTLNRTFAPVPGAILPFYQTANYQASKIKRAVMIMPGKPRDCWKYTSLVQDAFNVFDTNPQSAGSNPDGSVNNSAAARPGKDEVLILGPCWLSSDDNQAGAVRDGELYWHRSQWQSGQASRGPGEAAVSSYQVLDGFLDTLFNKAQFPNLRTVVLAGHSMGAQMVQRFSVAKQPASYDSNISYWVGNPGSFVWLTSNRPVAGTNANATCDGDADDWPYGLDDSGVPTYFRNRVRNSKQELLQTYQARNVHYNLGLLDNGEGDSSCEASLQGANHLERGNFFVEMLANMTRTGKLPATQTVNYMPNTSHVDYAMLSYNVSLYRLFQEMPTRSKAGNTAAPVNGGDFGASTAPKSGAAVLKTSRAMTMVLGGLAAAVSLL